MQSGRPPITCLPPTLTPPSPSAPFAARAPTHRPARHCKAFFSHGPDAHCPLPFMPAPRFSRAPLPPVPLQGGRRGHILRALALSRPTPPALYPPDAIPFVATRPCAHPCTRCMPPHPGAPPPHLVLWTAPLEAPPPVHYLVRRLAPSSGTPPFHATDPLYPPPCNHVCALRVAGGGGTGGRVAGCSRTLATEPPKPHGH